VAALARVSLKTASRVINGQTTVAPDLAEKVRWAAAALDYRPNLAARSLRSNDGRSRTIGLVLENVANPFSGAIHRAVEAFAAERGVAVLAGSVDENPARERALVAALIERRVDGLIMMPSGDDQSYLAPEQRNGLSTVFVDRPPQLLRGDTVASDNEGGAKVAVEHLISHGHERIAFLGDLRSIVTAAERYSGYNIALLEHGIRPGKELARFDLHDAASAELATKEILIEHAPTALFTSQNLITAGALRALRATGLSERVALVGFDDVPFGDMLQPPVTVVAQDPGAIGYLACKLLFDKMNGETPPPRAHLLPTSLIVRGSGEIAAQTGTGAAVV
jgi:LacI family transcriptional regulator